MKSLRNLFFVFALIAIPAFSQELTSDISGTVSSSDGSVSGAEITITYEPTNTTITRTTNSSGRYFAGGLRPGGPYKISVSATGLLPQNETTSLVVGETQRVSFSLNSAESAEEVVVTGSRITFDRDGFTTVIDSERIATIPSVTRDLKDILRLNPLITLDDEEDGEESISIGGAHPRTNDLSLIHISEPTRPY